MNKDVIYIEPEDDVTDIVTKINGTKEKIVALVPPKKNTVLRSIVNIKLIAKTGAAAGKTVVLVTTDPAVMKLAAATKTPVTKNLQSAPVIPVAEAITEEDTVSRETIVEENGEVKTEKIEVTGVADSEDSADSAENSERDLENSEKTGESEEEKSEKTEKSDEKSEKSEKKLFDKAKKEAEKEEKAKKVEGKNLVIAWILTHKPVAIGGGVGLIALILLFVWMFLVAPAATVTVGIRTTTSNFSENATFTTTASEENAAEGKFYLAEKKLETKSEVEFTATGEKNVGQKASGEVVVYYYFKEDAEIPVASGTVFYNNGLGYVAQTGATLKWDGKDASVCVNNGQASMATSGCLISARVPVVAEASGAKYNISANDLDWSTAANVEVDSDKAMEGGTDETVTIVQQSDIDKAKEELEKKGSSDNKEKLFDSIPENNLIISSSYEVKVGDATSSPSVGEEVKDNAKAKLSVSTTYSVFYVDMTKIEEFIREKAKLAENFKIYEMNDPFIENFLKGENGYTGKIKTSYVSGPEVTENSVIEVVKGKGVATAQHDLSEINGIGKIKIETSFPWVSSVPGDPEKIKVEINVEE